MNEKPVDEKPVDMDGCKAQSLSNLDHDTSYMMERYYEDSIEDPTMNSQPLEVYLHYAAIERQKEANDPRPIPDAPWTALFKRCTGRKHTIAHAPKAVKDGDGMLMGKLRRRKPAQPSQSQDALQLEENKDSAEVTPTEARPTQLEFGHNDTILTRQESQTAYRLLRVASWQLVFFLITTDVLGWYTAPMAFAQLGFAPGVLIYTCFYLLAFGSGQILWRMYLNLDSERYPIKCYADLGHRTYGPWIKHLFTVLQSIQLLFNVAMLNVMDGQGLATIIDYKFCYIAISFFFALLCMCFAQVKTLRGLAWLTNVNVGVNILVMVLTMVGVGLYDPVPSQSGHADLSEPIVRTAWVPAERTLYEQVSGVQLAVFAYGGAMIFPEFMTEMRRPRDFWKAAFIAQTFCTLMYQVFGIFVYAFQGQYTNILPTVNISSIIFQGVTNILGLVCIVVITIMYSHIGCKVFYRHVLRSYFRAPSLTSSKSTLYWMGTVIVYFLLAWVLGSAIPNIQDLNVIVGASCILQFTYTFPPFLLVGHWVQTDALAADAKWEPGVAAWSNRVDTWRDLSRWKRGFKPYWYAKVALILMSLGCLALCGLGMYAGIQGARASFAAGYSTSFSCRAPGQPLDK